MDSGLLVGQEPKIRPKGQFQAEKKGGADLQA